MDRYFRIGNFYFRIFGEENVYIPKNFLLFEVPQDNNQEFTFYLHIVEELPTINEKIHARRSDLIVYKIKDEEARLISTKGQDGAYALYREISNQGADIYLVADVLGNKDVNTTRKHYAAMSDEKRRMAAGKVKLRE